MTLVETGSLFFYNTYASYYYDALVRGDYDALMSLVASLPERTAMSTFFSLLVDLFLITLMGGYYIYCMGIRQGTEMPVTSLLGAGLHQGHDSLQDELHRDDHRRHQQRRNPGRPGS